MKLVRARSTGADIVVRYAGRRLRVSSEWDHVPVDAIEKLRAEGGELLEVDGDLDADAPEGDQGDGDGQVDAEPEAETEQPPADKPKGQKRARAN